MEVQLIASLEELYVCEKQDCPENYLYTHKGFQTLHCKKKPSPQHKPTKFNASSIYQPFLQLAKLMQLIHKKLSKTLNKFNADLLHVSIRVFYSSPIAQAAFLGQENQLNQFFFLYTIMITKGTQQFPIYYCCSTTICYFLSKMQLNDAQLQEAQRQLKKHSPEYQNIYAEYNFQMGSSFMVLENFIEIERNHFKQYCDRLNQNQWYFRIIDYLEERRLYPNQYPTYPVYFSREFNNFLIHKYDDFDEEQDSTFTSVEYFLKFWQDFLSIANNDEMIKKYFNNVVADYREYQQIMGNLSLQQSVLSFRMWRGGNKIQQCLQQLKNTYFLELFIYAFIEDLIDCKIYDDQPTAGRTWQQFGKYLRDFSEYRFKVDRQSIFQMEVYRQYFHYRKKYQDLQKYIRRNQKVVYKRDYLISYLTMEFQSYRKPGKKRYEAYFAEQDKIKEEDKAKKLSIAAELRAVLMQEEGPNFYDIIFDQCLSNCLDKGKSINRATYFNYKQNYISQIDEEYVRQLNQQHLKQKAAINQQISLKKQKLQSFEKKASQVDLIIGEKMLHNQEQPDQNEQRQQQVEIEYRQLNYKNESQKYVGDAVSLCPCCKNYPNNCKEEECLIMGFCTVCMID